MYVYMYYLAISRFAGNQSRVVFVFRAKKFDPTFNREKEDGIEGGERNDSILFAR